MKKIVLINFLVFVLLLFLSELIAMMYVIGSRIYQMNNNMLLDRHKNNVFQYIIGTYFDKNNFYHYDVLLDKMRFINNKELKKSSIILFGCSVTYGNLLDDKNNFSGILSRITKKAVYNMAFDGWGPAHMLKQLNENKSLLFLDDPEYIIYTFIKDHKRRLFFYQGWGFDSQLYWRYVINKDDDCLYPVKRKYPLYYRFYIVKMIQHTIENIKLRNEKLIDKYLLRIFEESVFIIKNRWPKAKLVMLVYNDELCENSKDAELYKTENALTMYEQEKIKEMGFEIINIEELAGKSFCGAEYHARCPIYGDLDKNHPSSKMWEEFVPKLVEKLNM